MYRNFGFLENWQNLPKTMIKTSSPDHGCQMAYLRPKIPIWVYFGGHGMENFGIFYSHFGMIYGRLV
jgi:hypothetical protein